MNGSRLTNRRAFLRLTVAGAIGTAIAAACQTTPPTPTPAPPTATTVPKPAPTSATAPQPAATTAPAPTPTTAPQPTATPATVPSPTAAQKVVRVAGVFQELWVGTTMPRLTGINVNFSGLGVDGFSFSSGEWAAWLESGTAPDVVEAMNPDAFLLSAKHGKVVDLNKAVGTQALKDGYDQKWLDWATMSGPSGPIVAGLFVTYYLNHVIWYPKPAFGKAGYKVPTTWDELTALSDRIVKAGGTPWGIANMTYGGHIGRMWAMDLLLRTAPLSDYDKLWKGELKFASPQVKKAVQTMAEFWLKPGYAYGGKDAINKTDFWELPSLMLDDSPKVWLSAQASHFPNWDGRSMATGFFGKELGVDYDYFVLPPIDKAYGAPVTLEGHFAAMLHDTDEARALMGHIASGAQSKSWVEISGGWGASPHKSASVEAHKSALDRKSAEIASKAAQTRFHALQLMPLEVFGQTGTSLMYYIAGTVDLDTALKQIDDAWAAVR